MTIGIRVFWKRSWESWNQPVPNEPACAVLEHFPAVSVFVCKWIECWRFWRLAFRWLKSDWIHKEIPLDASKAHGDKYDIWWYILIYIYIHIRGVGLPLLLCQFALKFPWMWLWEIPRAATFECSGNEKYVSIWRLHSFTESYRVLCSHNFMGVVWCCISPHLSTMPWSL